MVVGVCGERALECGLGEAQCLSQRIADALGLFRHLRLPRHALALLVQLRLALSWATRREGKRGTLWCGGGL